MTDADELRNKYKEAGEKLSSMDVSQQEEGVTRVIHQTDWIRILLTLSADGPERASAIEVELSVPCCSSNDCGSVYSEDDLIKGMSSHLDYLSTLTNAGFDLEIIKMDSIWTVTKDLNDQPKMSFFEMLLPPK
jgi:hypothetical protein